MANSTTVQLTKDWVKLGTAPMIISLNHQNPAIVRPTLPGDLTDHNDTEGAVLTLESVNPFTWNDVDDIYCRALDADTVVNWSKA